MDVRRECEAIKDPRIRRTRHALQDALGRLLDTGTFDQVSVGEISELAGVNRATFYDHYPDKFALLEALVARRFFVLLDARRIRFDGTCPSALKALILAVCDFLTDPGLGGVSESSSFQPLMESTVIALIRKVILEGPEKALRSSNLVATCASWAIYGAAKEWAGMADRASSESISDTILTLVGPILGFGSPHERPARLLES